MSTVVGHALVGIAVATGATSRKAAARPKALAAAAALVAALADADALVLLWTRGGAVVHRGATHGLAAATLLAACVALALQRPTKAEHAALKSAFVVLWLAAASHPLLDWAMGTGPLVRPLAPFSDVGYLAPVRLVPTAYYATAAAGLRSGAFWTANALAAGLEILLLAPLIVAVDRGAATRARILAAATSGAALFACLRFFN